MNCPHCDSSASAQRMKKNPFGYWTFHCHTCNRTFTERTGTPNSLDYPKDLVLLVVLWRLQYKLSPSDLADMCLARGLEVTHKSIRDWEERFAPLMVEQLHAKRKGQVGRSCYRDETYVKVHGTWGYFYRAIDRGGNLVDSMLSEAGERDGAKHFFQQARAVVGHRSTWVTTAGHSSYRRVIGQTLRDEVTPCGSIRTQTTDEGSRLCNVSNTSVGIRLSSHQAGEERIPALTELPSLFPQWDRFPHGRAVAQVLTLIITCGTQSCC